MLPPAAHGLVLPAPQRWHPGGGVEGGGPNGGSALLAFPGSVTPEPSELMVSQSDLSL